MSLKRKVTVPVGRSGRRGLLFSSTPGPGQQPDRLAFSADAPRNPREPGVRFTGERLDDGEETPTTSPIPTGSPAR